MKKPASLLLLRRRGVVVAASWKGGVRLRVEEGDLVTRLLGMDGDHPRLVKLARMRFSSGCGAERSGIC